MSGQSRKVADRYCFDGDFAVDGKPLHLTSQFQPWDAGIVLAKYFEHKYNPSQIGRRLHCLELGSGTGIAGLSLALLGHHVVLTDAAEEHIENSRSHILQNDQSITAAGGSATSETVDWTALPVRDTFGSFDLVFASDVIWNGGKVEPFVEALSWAALGSGVLDVVLAHKIRNDMGDLLVLARFEKLAKQAGFTISDHVRSSEVLPSDGHPRVILLHLRKS